MKLLKEKVQNYLNKVTIYGPTKIASKQLVCLVAL